ncbi:prepilin peptidase [Streptomyces decoyicus]|uniref:prepilin peptidase n=1 Tax=Streptomyces decoyicus TaxID=249567 RepID=UPI0030E0FCA4|nr:A24 family peptidase [Streptomyces tubercidicus]WSV46927.1 A24 family peptidase [Streptomyces decoyicus]
MLIATVLLVAGAALGTCVRAAVFHYAVAVDDPRLRDCPSCSRPLLPQGRVPLRPLAPHGRCPGCRTRIGPLPALPETLTALAFIGAALAARSPWSLVAGCWLALFGITLALIDIEVHRLPDPLNLTAGTGLLLLMAAATITKGDAGPLLRALIAAAVLGAFYLAMTVFGSMGLGDGKLSLVLGLALGWLGWQHVLTGTCAAFLLGGIYGVVLLLTRRATRKDPLPFGPFMISGAALVILLSACRFSDFVS